MWKEGAAIPGQTSPSCTNHFASPIVLFETYRPGNVEGGISRDTQLVRFVGLGFIPVEAEPTRAPAERQDGMVRTCTPLEGQQHHAVLSEP